MSTRAVIDGIPNEPVSSALIDRLIEPLLDVLGGVERRDVASLTIGAHALRAKVAVRNKRGRRLPRSWAHIEVSIVDDTEEGS